MGYFEELRAMSAAGGVTPADAHHPLELAERYAEHMAAGRPVKPAAETPAPLGVREVAPPSEKPTARSAAELAEALYGQTAFEIAVPDAVRQWREQNYSAADRLYDAPLGAVATAVRTVAGLPEGAHEPLARELSAIARDTGFAFAEALEDFDRAAREVHALDDTGRAALRERALAALRTAFGDRADAALQAAQALVARDPRVGRILDSTGAGDSPRLVIRLAREALAQRAAGKLK
ncbi:MAG: hypothetical protein AB1761_16785 [Pseudomonadota bacterium]